MSNTPVSVGQALSPANPQFATIELVSLELSSSSQTPPAIPPPDRIEQLSGELDAKIREYRPREGPRGGFVGMLEELRATLSNRKPDV
jgi:hypothetical protein